MDTFMDQVDTSTKSFYSIFSRILLLSILLVGFSCKESENELVNVDESVFFNDSKHKLWGHKANTPDKANAFLEEYKGIEFDVVFEAETNRFNVRHDIDVPSSPYYLKDFFKSIANYQEAYYWLDFKNLGYENASASASSLIQTFNELQILDRCIVESFNFQELKVLAEKGLNVSFWVPYLGPNSTTQDSLNSKNLIQEAIDFKKINALSAPYQMYEFLNENFPDQNMHIWTNGLTGDQGKVQIKDFNKQQNIKVILVDYEENFLQ